MTDVVKIAKERQARLSAEIGKLGDFIRMAEALVKYRQSKSSKASATDDEKPTELTGPATVRPFSTTANRRSMLS